VSATESRLLIQYWERRAFVLTLDTGLVTVDGIAIAGEHIGIHIGVTHWVDVTHIPTGRKLAAFQTLGAAMELAHRIVYLRDWSSATLQLSSEEVKRITDLIVAVKATEHMPHRVLL